MPNPKRRPSLFNKDKKLNLFQYADGGWGAKFINTRIFIKEGVQFNNEIGNLLTLVRAQQVDHEALCRTKKLKVLRGKATTVSEVALSDEALEALYQMLRLRFEGVPTLKEGIGEKKWKDHALMTFIDGWPVLTDEQLTHWLNEMNLPYRQLTMAIDYYKKLGPYANDDTNPEEEQNPGGNS